MFTNSEKKLLGGGYFIIIREEEKFIEVKSRNTGHCWMIFKKTYDPDRPIVLHHKHSITDVWYHEHKRGWSVEEMVKEIKKHDKYVVAHPNYLKRKKNGYKPA